MANNKIQDSIFKIAGNFAVNAGAPFDSRTLVDNVEDLTAESTWYQKKTNPSDPDKKILLYNGLTVTIATTGEIYVLTDKDNITDTNSWKKIGGSSITIDGDDVEEFKDPELVDLGLPSGD